MTFGRISSWVAVCVALAGPAHAGYIDHYATSADVGVDKAPAHGRSSVLVIPVVVEEAGLPSEEVLLAGIDEFFALTGDGFTFRNYYRAASLERFDPHPHVAPVVRFSTCPFARDTQGRCTIARGDLGVLAQAFVALEHIYAVTDEVVDFAAHDLNGSAGEPDGVVDGIIVVTNLHFGGIALPQHRLCKIGKNLCGGMSWDPTYDGVLVPWTAVSGAYGGDVDGAVFTSVHEFGHLLGLADLYDESGATTDLPYSLMGGWEYDASAWLPDAFSRYVLGWAEPVQASGAGRHELHNAATSGEVLKLGVGDEFFLVEHRGARGLWDADIGPDGLAIYHVNLERRPSADSLSFLTTMLVCVNCDRWTPMVMLEQADGLFELQAGSGQRDDAGDLFREGDALVGGALRAPNSDVVHVLDTNFDDGTPSGIAITRITRAGGVYTVEVDTPAIASRCAELICAPGTRCEGGRCVLPARSPEGCAASSPSAVVVGLLIALRLVLRSSLCRGH